MLLIILYNELSHNYCSSWNTESGRYYFYIFFLILFWLQIVIDVTLRGFVTFCLSSDSSYHNQDMDGWMTCDFMSFSTVFQSYQDNGQMIMKGSVQWNPVYD